MRNVLTPYILTRKIEHTTMLFQSGRVTTVVPAKSDNFVIFCLHLKSKSLTCTLTQLALTRIDISIVY